MSGSSSAASMPGVRQPTIGMLVNGKPMPGLKSLSVSQNNFLAADTFRATVALGATGQGNGPPLWATQDSLELTLRIGQASQQPATVIVGLVDHVSLDLVRQQVMLSGRDYTGALIDVKTSEKFLNLTSSQVVQTLAQRQGLQAQVTATTTPVGKYYDADHASVTNEVSYWTLMSYLAQQEGFDIFVSGKTVCFQPPPDASKGTYAIRYSYGAPIPSANVTDLKLDRDLTLAKDIKVKVISWNHEKKASISSTKQKTKTVSTGKAAAPSAPTASTPTLYVFREPGLTQAQADASALAHLNDLTKHERRIAFDMPGDLTLTPRTVVALSGTGTDFDQSYFVSEIDIDASLQSGFSLRARAKNSSPQSVVTL